MDHLRIIDFGDVNYLLSQACYHGVARAMRADTPDTVTLCSPAQPYVCVGYHQEVAKEVDVDWCREHNLPILRRQVGGGTVLLDRGQIFWHLIVHRSRCPVNLEEAYRLYLTGPINALRRMGIEAYFRPVNDVHVGGRKIMGTGAATIGEAMVFVGSLLLDFDYETMVKALKVPSEKFRDKVYQTMKEYLTTINRERGKRMPRTQAKQILSEEMAKALGVTAFAGNLEEREGMYVTAMERQMADPEWVWQGGGLPKVGVKIAEGVRVLESAFKAPGGLVRATVCLKDDRIADLSLSGDFFFFPQDGLPDLARSLIGQPLDEAALTQQISQYFAGRGVQAPGLSPADLARAVTMAAQAA